MKAGLIFICCLFLYLPLHGNNMKALTDLEAGDWFLLEYSKFWSNPDSILSKACVDVFECRTTLLSRTKDVLELSVRPVRFNRNGNGPGIRKVLYFDSYYSDPQIDKEYYFGQNDSVIIRLNLHSGAIEDIRYELKQDQWLFPISLLISGIKKETHFIMKTVDQENATVFFLNLIRRYFDEINIQKKLPYLLEDKTPGRNSYRIRLIDASIPLFPNIKISFSFPDNSIPENLRFEVDNQRHITYQIAGGKINVEFYLAHPAVGKMAGINLLLSPGDSLSVVVDRNGDCSFSGKGAVDNRYYFELHKQQSFFSMGDQTYWFPSKKELEQYVMKGDSIYKSLWSKYASQMSPFWLQSSRLSFKYWYMYKYINLCDKTSRVNDIPWEDEVFMSIMPFSDYTYNPQCYHSFISVYCNFKIRQLHEDALTGTRNFSDNLVGKYYLQKGLFSGYPKYFLMFETLSMLMEERNLLSFFQREYQDFIAECRDPIMLGKINRKYNEMLKIQPGENIRELHLVGEKEIPLKKRFDGYIVVVMGALATNTYEKALAMIEDSLLALGLNEKIQIVRPDAYKGKTAFDAERGIVNFNSSEDLRKDSRILKSKPNDLLFIRNDGTIVANNIRDYWLNDRNGNKYFKMELLTDLMQEDMKRIEESKSGFSIFWIILGVSFFSGGITYIIYRIRIRLIRKKEENKRLISELELKAIRSQMNPHFIFNALGSIQHLINQGKNNEANKYLLDFSKLLRMVLAGSEKKLIPLSEELEQLDLYLKLEQLRLPFDYLIVVDKNIWPDNESIPGMLVQPIVENALIHGIFPNQGGSINIHFRKEDHILLAEITDDGPGFPKSINSCNGFGLKATEERLNLINEEYKTDVGIQYRENEPKGTRVTILIPV